MRLREYEGKELFRKYGIETPRGIVVGSSSELPRELGASFVKAQVLSGNRKQAGGVIAAKDHAQAEQAIESLIGKKIGNERVEKILVENSIAFDKEYYVSFSYDGASCGPVLALNASGGSGIGKARVVPIDLLWGIPDFFLRDALVAAKFPGEDISGVSKVIGQLWELFTKEYALLAEINPLFRTKERTFIAGDAKVILDDEKVNPTERRYIEMDGDIAILASGGGASMLNMDALLRAGGKPANYTEYSGNPPAELVKELTKRVLGKRGLKGAWVVGAAANFTDIYTTLSGLLDGLREINPKPTYPIVIRRDGPRRKEAFEMLREVGAKEDFDFHLYDETTPMIATAKIITKLAYGANHPERSRGTKNK